MYGVLGACGRFARCERASCDTAPEDCPTGAKERVGQMREVDDLTQELMRDRIFFEESGGGVTISGGECLAGKARQQAVFTLLKRLHDAGISTAVETTLACELALDLAELVRVCDTFLVDFKIANRAESIRVTGIDPAVRDSNLRTLLNDGVTWSRGFRLFRVLPIATSVWSKMRCVR